MAKMWYTCAKTEHKLFDGHNTRTINAGALFTAVKKGERAVLLTPYEPADGYKAPLSLHVDAARELFVTPSTDVSAVIEQSIMLCEAAYC